MHRAILAARTGKSARHEKCVASRLQRWMLNLLDALGDMEGRTVKQTETRVPGFAGDGEDVDRTPAARRAALGFVILGCAWLLLPVSVGAQTFVNAWGAQTGDSRLNSEAFVEVVAGG